MTLIHEQNRIEQKYILTFSIHSSRSYYIDCMENKKKKYKNCFKYTHINIQTCENVNFKMHTFNFK